MGTTKGWETRKARTARLEREWEDSIAEAARTDERLRIRRELAKELERIARATGSGWFTLRHAIAALDRICPEERPVSGISGYVVDSD